MKLFRDTIVAGRTIMRSFRASTRIKTQQGEKRKPKTEPTPEAVRKVNFRNAVWKLCALLNSNFFGGDYHLTLTYANEPSKAEAKKMLDKFIRNLRSYHKKNGTEFKWVSATEYEHKRIHHHIVISRTDLEVIEKYWPHGWVTPKLMDSTGNYIKLAEYLIKETDKTFREEDSPYKQRYNRSRNLILPEVKRQEVYDTELRNDPKEIKGYYIDRDTIRKYDHAILGVECMEYIMVSLGEEPRLKKWRRGEKAKFESYYKSAESQLSMSGLICDEEL